MLKAYRRKLTAFTLVETIITVSILVVLVSIAVIASTAVIGSSRDSARDAKARIVSSALEKYYRNNGEYPSVAAMTNANVDAVKTKIGVANADVFKMPNSQVANSITTANPSPVAMVYGANTSDATKNTQCQTDANGYCDGYILQYVKESTGDIVTITSLNTTFEAVRDGSECDEGDTRSGNTCTHTYPATYQNGVYTCPNGGTLSGTTCTNTYAATYYSGGYYTCPNGGTLNGSTCTTSYAATSTTTYSCPYGGSYQSANQTCYMDSTSTPIYTCPHPADSVSGSSCIHMRGGYTTKSSCQAAGYNWAITGSGNDYCYSVHSADPAGTSYSCPSGWTHVNISGGGYCTRPAASSTTYTCPNGGTLNGTTCTSSYAATYYSSSGYYCPSGGTLNGTTCTSTYSASQSPGYYTCPQGGTVSGTTCSYTYQLED